MIDGPPGGAPAFLGENSRSLGRWLLWSERVDDPFEEFAPGFLVAADTTFCVVTSLVP